VYDLREAMRRLIPVLLLAGCPAPTQAPGLFVQAEATVYVSFGADSAITADDWSFCTGSGLNCSFPASGVVELPLDGKFLNATLAFDAPVGCGQTKVELNLNNPAWYDTLDVSLVDGYSVPVKVSATDVATGKSTVLGPVLGDTGNEDTYGVFPLGCDVCVQREAPPCGMAPGPLHGDGCKLKGTQYAPEPPCQHQGPTKGGGGTRYLVELLK
jgi:hypothetical protein